MSVQWWASLLIASAIGGCKNDPTVGVVSVTCAAQAPPACALNDGGAAAPFVPCIQDECSLATLRGIITAEIQAATLGTTHAASPGARAVAAKILADFEAQTTNLDALEAQLAVKETACDESQRTSTDLGADFAMLAGQAGSAFDTAFLASQKAALTEIKRTINFDLIGCAGNGNLKTTLRFDRLRSPDGGTTVTAYDGGSELGVVPDLAAVIALIDAGAAPTPADSGASDASSEN